MARTAAAMLNRALLLHANLLLSPPTQADVSRHLAQLREWFRGDTVSGAVFLAHSQGNLFANAAYRGFKATAPLANLQVAHVAPASPTLNGAYLLADIDVVINGLRATGIAVPPSNLVLPFDATDRTGHTFDATYLDPKRAGLAATKELVKNALDRLY